MSLTGDPRVKSSELTVSLTVQVFNEAVILKVQKIFLMAVKIKKK